MNSKNTVSEQKALPLRTQERMYISVGVFLTLPFTFIHLADALLRHFFLWCALRTHLLKKCQLYLKEQFWEHHKN